MIGREATCAACGETFIPSDDNDLVHLEREDGKVCGGVGAIVGTWSGAEDVSIRCAECGSPNVSYAIWHHPNNPPGDRAGELFGSWHAGDNTFCDDCEENSDLVDRGAEPHRFAKALALWNAKHPTKEK